MQKMLEVCVACEEVFTSPVNRFVLPADLKISVADVTKAADPKSPPVTMVDHVIAKKEVYHKKCLKATVSDAIDAINGKGL